MSFDDFKTTMTAKAEEKKSEMQEQLLEQKYNFVKSIVANNDITDVETFSEYMQDKMDNFKPKMPFKLVLQQMKEKNKQFPEEKKQAMMAVS